MKGVIFKLNNEKVIKELGQSELENMYSKVDKIYVGTWNMQKKSAKDFSFSDKDAVVYCGEIEYQDVIGASLGMEKHFKWLKDYVSIWEVYDSEDDELEDLTEGLLDA